ncbi:MAG TPA: nucleotidyltransferase family protein [Gemmatimonadaceae bacterium]|nr:nucleotidyltransferase family protein [Gemmatimonadaceae bacterium]
MNQVETERSAPLSASTSVDWRRGIISESSTLQDAIRNLNESSLQIALVVAADGQLIGTLTDGDIRRGLLNRMRLESMIGPIVFRAPLVVPPQVSRETVLQLMQANKVRQLPVVDEERQLLGLHVWDELLLPTVRGNTMVIMAGGRGSRLRPHTDACPKPMLHVGGKPMLEHIVERASTEGFRRFVLATHYLGHMIEDHFGDGSRWQVEIEYLREPSPLGTAGAISLLVPRPEEPIVVSNGDVLTDIRYGELLDFHLRHGAAATMAVRLHEWEHPFGVVLTKGVDIVGFEEKPVSRSHVNAGIYALSPEALDALVIGEPCDMPLLITRVKAEGARTIVYPMHEPWLDLGRDDDLRRANSHS